MSGKQKKMGHVLVVPKSEALRAEPKFLLTGDSFAESRYQIALQVFSYLKKDGEAFQLSISVPRLLQQKIGFAVMECGLDECATVLSEPPATMDHYQEIIDITDMLGKSFILRKADRVINMTASSLMMNLEGAFEVRDQ